MRQVHKGTREALGLSLQVRGGKEKREGRKRRERGERDERGEKEKREGRKRRERGERDERGEKETREYISSSSNSVARKSSRQIAGDDGDDDGKDVKGERFATVACLVTDIFYRLPEFLRCV